MSTSAPLPERSRLAALDVLRGLALCGILLVNIPIIAADAAGAAGLAAGPSAAPSAGPVEVPSWLALVASQRFLPVFALLFGIGFALLLESARRRSPRPRVVLLRRLLALLGIGLAHLLLWPGEILTAYAVIGLVVLLPSTWLPRSAVTALAGVCLGAALLFGGGGPLLVVALFLTGSALVRFGLVERMDRSRRGPALAGAGFAVAAVPALWWKIQSEGEGSGHAMAVAGLLVAGVYVCAVLVLMRTRLRPFLIRALAPLGRTALTHYLSATVLVTAAALLWGLRGGSTAELLLAAAAVIGVQWVFSVLWLRRHRHGPVEALWRWATWGRTT